MVFVEPRTIQPVMAGGGAEIPHPRVARAGKKAIPDQLVASPLADDGARNVADVVLIEAQDGAKPGVVERLPGTGQAIAMEPLEIDALLEIDLCCAGSLKRPVPAVRRLEVIFVDRKKLRLVQLLRHDMPPTSTSSYESQFAGMLMASARSLRNNAACAPSTTR